MEEQYKNLPEYDDNEAIEVIMDSISDELRGKMSEDDIGKIIDLKYEYLESLNLVVDPDKPSFVTYMADFDDDELDKYVIFNALKHDIYLSIDELQEIWAGDQEYLETKGLLGDMPLEEMN